jgi:hypothetical protein
MEHFLQPNYALAFPVRNLSNRYKRIGHEFMDKACRQLEDHYYAMYVGNPNNPPLIQRYFNVRDRVVNEVYKAIRLIATLQPQESPKRKERMCKQFGEAILLCLEHFIEPFPNRIVMCANHPLHLERLVHEYRRLKHGNNDQINGDDLDNRREAARKLFNILDS